MNKEYEFEKIEKSWQKKWEEKNIFQVSLKNKKKKYYVLEMFPYPSGSGLHMGHAFNYVIGDVYARFKRMQRFNVLYPMGYDALGLPAENAAIKVKEHPKKYTERAINNFIKQQKSLGLSYDWNRMLKTCDPEYYKWNQYFFLKFLEKGLVYRKKAPVNFCKKCNTVLANEQVHNGKCWRHEDTDVEITHLEQWFIKTTKYADELLEGLKEIDWPKRIKIMQENWIGKSEGTEILFEIKNEKWPVFTTRPDTIYGVSFMVISAQHQKLMEIVTKEQKKEVENFLKKIKSTSEKSIHESDDLEKEGVFTGSYATNPINGEKVPIWIGNFVIADYGSGLVMGVPAHDSRDFDFAKKYNLAIKIVITKNEKTKSIHESYDRAYEGNGILINSEIFNGLENNSAKEKITNFLNEKGLGKKSTQYKLKDWLISRQRYWGTPIPIVYCDKCGIVPVKEKDLPIALPEKVKFGKGNPLETNKNWVNISCPKCKSKAKRETDTMDTFFDSSWYFLRFTDNKNSKEPFSEEKANYWMSVDQYIGGAEHACMHLIYARFFTKVLRDLGFFGKNKINEPFEKLFNQGMLHGEDGHVMSKSRGNVVLPEIVSKKYGIDTARLFLVSIASPDKDIQWSENGVEGNFKFIKKIISCISNIKIGKSSKKFQHKINKTIEKVTEDIENFNYNLAVIKIKELFESFENEIDRKDLESFIKILSPFCPHVSEELWKSINKNKNADFVSLEKWPKADKTKINEEFDKKEKIVESLSQDINNIAKIIKEKENKKTRKVFIYSIPKEKEIYSENIEAIRKKTNLYVEIYAVNDKEKYDPSKKSNKAKPGKPALYLE